jgi:hypothetical protein
VKEVKGFCIKRILNNMPSYSQPSRYRRIEVPPESFCSCKDSDVGERMLCSCGEELSGMYKSVYLLKEKVW